MNTSNPKNNKLKTSNEDEINLTFVKNFFLRNKFPISLSSIILCFLAYFYSFTLKRVWQGEFQIVLNDQVKQNKVNLNLDFSSINSRSNNLLTQVTILESPSVLKPIFDFVVSKKQTNDPDFKEDYLAWKDNFEVELKKNTTVLNITYRDEDKELIMPLLNKVSTAYQDYSGRNKKKTQELTKNYLYSQIQVFNKKSSQSLRDVQDFAIEQDLLLLDPVGQENTLDLSIANTSIENRRVQAANEIRKIDLQIKKIKELNDENIDEIIYYGSLIPALEKQGLPQEIKESEDRLLVINNQLEQIYALDKNDIEALQYIASTIPALEKQGLPSELKSIQASLLTQRSKYTDNDLSIKRLLEEKALNIDLLRERAINYLKVEKLSIENNRNPRIVLLKDRAINYLIAARVQAEAKMESAMRPKGVLLKYKELIRKASRDESTLIELESKLRKLELEEAKTQEPWELITNPTLKESPVAPSRKFFGMIGLLGGFIFGAILSFYKEKKSDNIYEIEELENIFNSSIIESLNKNDLNIESEKIKFIQTFFSLKKDKKILFIYLSDLLEKDIKNLVNNIKKLNIIEKIDYEDVNNLNGINLNDEIYLFVSLKYLNYSKLNVIKKRFETLSLNFEGIFIFD